MKKLIGILSVAIILVGCKQPTTLPTTVDTNSKSRFSTNSTHIEVITICDVEENVEYMYVSPISTYDGSSLIMLRTSFDKPKPCR